MKLLSTAAAALLCAVGLTASASTSIATATLTDSDGQVWANCSWNAVVVSPRGTPTIAGAPVASSLLNVKGSCSASGVLSGTFLDTSSIQQSGASYTFTIQPNASVAPSVIASVAVTGATPSLSTVLSAGLNEPRFPPGPTAYGYGDQEVLPNPPPGAIYYNVITPCLRQLSNAGWTCGGGSTSSGILTAGATADYNFLQGSGTTLTDQSGNGNNGTLGAGANAPTWTQWGMQFAGLDNVSLPAALNSTRTLIAAVYLNPLLTDTSAYTGAPVIATSSTGASGLNFVMYYYDNVLNNLYTMMLSPGMYGGSPTTFANVRLSGFHVFTYVLGSSSSSTVDHLYIDGQEVANYNYQGASAGLQTTGNLFLGPSGASPWNSGNVAQTMYRVRTYATALSASDVQAVSAAIRAEVAARGVDTSPVPLPMGVPSLNAVGDSITFGAGVATPWPSLLSLTGQPAYTVRNWGITGIRSAEVLGAEPNRVARYCGNNLTPSVATVFMGTNDFDSALQPAQTTFNNIAAEVKLLKRAGCTVFVGTMLDRAGTYETKKDLLDPIILQQARTIGADGIIDFAANPLLGADGAATNTTYFQGDQTHPTQAGQQLLANIASNTLNYYFGSSLTNPHVVTANTYQMLSSDGAVTAAPTANAAYTMPDCTGPSGMTYTISNPQSAFTLTVIGGTNQPINGLATAITIPSNSSVALRDVPNPKTTSGCHWAM